MLICEALLVGIEKNRPGMEARPSRLAFSSHYIIAGQGSMSCFAFPQSVLGPGVNMAAEAGPARSLCWGILFDVVS